MDQTGGANHPAAKSCTLALVERLAVFD